MNIQLTYANQLSRGEVWDLINRFNPATFLCLYQARSWISNTICHGFFLCSVIWHQRLLFVLLILI